MYHAQLLPSVAGDFFLCEENRFFILHSCCARLLFQLWCDEQVAKTDFRMCACWEQASVTLSGTQTFDLSKTGLPFSCHCVNRRGHLDSLSSPNTDLIPKSHKVTPRRTEPLFFWIYITEPPPKARGNGKMEFPAHFNGQPWASWFEGTTELWHAQQRMLFRCSEMPRDWAYRREPARSNSQRELSHFMSLPAGAAF